MPEFSDKRAAALSEAYHAVEGVTIEHKACDKICRAICSYRDLADEFTEYPEKVAKDLVAGRFDSGKAYFPCDVVALRPILQTKVLFVPGELGLFSFDVCKKYLLDYPLLLAISLEGNPEDGFNRCGGVYVEKENPLDVSQRIERVIIREECITSAAMKTVEDLTSKLCPSVEVRGIGDVPGTRTPRLLASREAKMRNWYKHVKTADASSSEDPGSAPYLEGGPVSETSDEITFGPNLAPSPYQRGDKVRLRAGGLGFSQAEGVVTKVNSLKMIVEWMSGNYKGKETTFDLLDTVRLHSSLEKVL